MPSKAVYIKVRKYHLSYFVSTKYITLDSFFQFDLKKKMVDYHKPIVLTHASLNFTTPFLAIHVPSIIFSL